MSRTRWIGLSLALFATTALTAISVQAQQQSTGEAIGEKLDEAGAAVKRGVGKATDAVKEQYGRAKSSVHAMSVEGRVYSRLHWDKSLSTATIDVTLAKDGTATLTGTVVTASAKAKAVELTNETVGVTGVIDQLTLTQATESRSR